VSSSSSLRRLRRLTSRPPPPVSRPVATVPIASTVAVSMSLPPIVSGAARDNLSYQEMTQR
jgi:hypothetical protein